MVFINTGSRWDSNPYSSPRLFNGGGGRHHELSRKVYPLISPRICCALTAVVVVWLVLIVFVLYENMFDIRQEVLDDIAREENMIRGRIRRGRLRAEEWLVRRIEADRDGDGAGGAVQSSQKQHRQGEEEERWAHEWDLTLLEDLALRTGPDDTPIHMVFSTDCSPYQHWQSYQFFVSALRIRQPGRVTQIASGCSTGEEARAMREWFDVHVAPLSLRFGLHLTPSFSGVKDGDGNVVGEYDFFNKPFGLLHWMETGDGMGVDTELKLPKRHDTIIAMLDPDQMLVKPITGRFAPPQDIFRGGDGNGENVDTFTTYREKETEFVVRHGHPASQEYGFRDAWRKYASVAGAGSPATKVTPTEALRSYAVGPPYIATAMDMYRISVKWCEFVPEVHKLFPELLAEMYAFSIATAHLALPHQLVASLMVSDTSQVVGNDVGGGEGWKFIDAIPGEIVCPFATYSLDADVRPLPLTLHLCHRYGVGDRAFFAKKKLPEDFFSCGSPLLEEPPMDIGSGKYLYRKPPFLDKRVAYSAAVEKREAFMVCSAIGFLNEVATFFKNRHCRGREANLTKVIALHDLPE